MTLFSKNFRSQEFVKSVFSRVASRYDLMNDLMSLGIHRRWKKRFVEGLSLRPHMTILDVATGTGDILRLLMEKVAERKLEATFTALDTNEEMVREAQAKFINKGILTPMTWVVAPAESIPLADESQDLYTIAFGLRNVEEREKALSEAYRVLKPGGQFACLEFSQVQQDQLRGLYDMYSRHVIPRVGKWVAGDEEAYRYLVDSIRAFPDAPTLADMLQSVGFKTVSYDLLSQGIVAIHWGWKA